MILAARRASARVTMCAGLKTTIAKPTAAMKRRLDPGPAAAQLPSARATHSIQSSTPSPVRTRVATVVPAQARWPCTRRIETT